jgi:hypothetical protein
MKAADVEKILVLPPGYQGRRAEIAEAVVTATEIVQAFAKRYGWSDHAQEPFFRGVEIFATREALWQRMLDLNNIDDLPMPTDAVTAALEEGILLAVVREEAERARPEYFAEPQDWVKTLAHEIVHRLHVRILGGNEEAMGPEWFYEGFAVFGSGQPLGKDEKITDVEDALKAAHRSGRGAYASYAAALRFLAERIPLPELVARAHEPDFADWLRLAVQFPGTDR